MRYTLCLIQIAITYKAEVTQSFYYYFFFGLENFFEREIFVIFIKKTWSFIKTWGGGEIRKNSIAKET